MSFDPTTLTLDAWKRQVDTALRIAEAFVEGAEKAREIQLGAGVDAHAWLEANRRVLAGELLAYCEAEPAAGELNLRFEKLAVRSKREPNWTYASRQFDRRVLRALAGATT